MKTRATICVLASIFSLSLCRTSAAYCIGWDKSLTTYDAHYYSVAQELNRSTFVVIAAVVRATWLGYDGKPKLLEPPFQSGGSQPFGLDAYLGALYEVRVMRTIKGNPGAKLTIFSENSTARFPLSAGTNYLLFISNDNFDLVGTQLTVDSCGNSGVADGKKAELLQLKDLTG